EAAAMNQAPVAVAHSVWSPLKFPLFRVMWVAMTISNIGTWMNEVGVTWLMATLAPSNLMIALIQTATTLPFFLLAYPAGTLGDIFNRRVLLVVLHLWMLASAVLLALLTHQGMASEWWLLALTFALGAGNAMMRPPWSANIPTFAPPEQLSNAVTLNSLSTNISKAIGPAIGGVLISASGPALVFALNAISFVFVILALVFRHPKVANHHSTLPMERFVAATKAGVRYIANEPDLRAVLVRCSACFVFISSYWSMMPVIAIREMGASAQTYGLLIGATGLGSIIGATALPAMRRNITHNRQFDVGSLVFAVGLLAIAVVRDYWLLALLSVLIGICWIVLFSTIVVTAQLLTPSWVLARILSIVMLVYGGTTAAGSALWGHLSDIFNVRTSLFIAAPGLLLSLLLSRKFPIPQERSRDLSVLLPSPEPEYFTRVSPAAGPVMVILEYCVEIDRQPDFLVLMDRVRPLRKRNGAFFWALFQNPEQPDCFQETFLVESWLDYLRQRERATASDRALEQKVVASAGQPLVRHYVAREARGF
ncbi:MAG: MFS transporter, partial [Porticoccaceae bacterium]